MNQAFLSINEASSRLDVPAHTLRYWEKQFPGAIKPALGAGGRRYYRPETITALTTIRELLYDKGMTINGVKKLIKEGGIVPSQCSSVSSITGSRVSTPTGGECLGTACGDGQGGANNFGLSSPPSSARDTSSADIPPRPSSLRYVETSGGEDAHRVYSDIIKLLELAKAELD